jgi:hypothetical protein
MSLDALGRLEAAHQKLIAALDANDVEAIEARVEGLRDAVAAVRAAGAWRDLPDLKRAPAASRNLAKRPEFASTCSQTSRGSGCICLRRRAAISAPAPTHRAELTNRTDRLPPKGGAHSGRAVWAQQCLGECRLTAYPSHPSLSREKRKLLVFCACHRIWHTHCRAASEQ